MANPADPPPDAAPAPPRPAWLARLLDLLLPPRCAGCRRRGVWLCAACLAALERPRPPLCPRCGASLAQGARCWTCQRHPPVFDRVWAAYRHAGPLRPAIHRFKYGGERALAAPLGRLLAAAAADLGLAADLIVPVPLHPGRLHQRGYNQSALLAAAVATALACPLGAGLARTRPTPPQVGQDAARRRANVAGAFAWRGADLAGRRLLLVDDVCTTGATFDACAAALRPSAPARVEALALARG